MNSSITLLADWLLNSGIQNISDNEWNGGFNAWYNLDKKEYAYVYSEITGYGITTLLQLHKLTGRGIFLDRAMLAANWLINIAMENNYTRARYYENGFDNTVYSFDNGMVLFGLANLYRLTQMEKYLDFSVKIADFLLGMQKSDGLFYSIYDTGEKKNLNIGDKWSTVSGSYHAKLSLGLLAVHDILNEAKYRKAAIKVCEESIKFQKNGRFLTLGNETHLHPHSYSAEGLLYAGLKLDKNRFVESALNAVVWSLNNQQEDGGMPSSYPSDKNERNDVLAQTLRLGTIFLQQKDINEKERIEKLRKRLLESQNLSTEHKGGFFYGFENGKKLNHINSWVSMFALQALIFYDKYLKKEGVELDLFV
ncbi:MAG: hypothetical protein V1900_00815 [Candidatus Aenigmatarchaeota archaeon]